MFLSMHCLLSTSKNTTATNSKNYLCPAASEKRNRQTVQPLNQKGFKLPHYIMCNIRSSVYRPNTEMQSDDFWTIMWVNNFRLLIVRHKGVIQTLKTIPNRKGLKMSFFVATENMSKYRAITELWKN